MHLTDIISFALFVTIQMIKLFIGGFPLDITELQLVELVSRHGEVITIKIVRDKKTKICKGYAFLEMKDLYNAENAVDALDGIEYQGRKLSVSYKVEESVLLPKKQDQTPEPAVSRSYIKVSNPKDVVKKKRPRRSF